LRGHRASPELRWTDNALSGDRFPGLWNGAPTLALTLASARARGHMRILFGFAMAASLAAASAVAAQTTSAPAPSAPSAPPSGGVTQMPAPPTNSTPSQSNVDASPPTRLLPNPAPSAAPPNAGSPGQRQPGGVAGQQGASPAQKKGGPNDRNPAGSNTADCMKLWDPQTPVSKQAWARACERNQAGLKKPGE
jgi:hypothetical protein